MRVFFSKLIPSILMESLIIIATEQTMSASIFLNKKDRCNSKAINTQVEGKDIHLTWHFHLVLNENRGYLQNLAKAFISKLRCMYIVVVGHEGLVMKPRESKVPTVEQTQNLNSRKSFINSKKPWTTTWNFLKDFVGASNNSEKSKMNSSNLVINI